jgi:hypothetical protein
MCFSPVGKGRAMNILYSIVYMWAWLEYTCKINKRLEYLDIGE